MDEIEKGKWYTDEDNDGGFFFYVRDLNKSGNDLDAFGFTDNETFRNGGWGSYNDGLDGIKEISNDSADHRVEQILMKMFPTGTEYTSTQGMSRVSKGHPRRIHSGWHVGDGQGLVLDLLIGKLATVTSKPAEDFKVTRSKEESDMDEMLSISQELQSGSMTMSEAIEQLTPPEPSIGDLFDLGLLYMKFKNGTHSLVTRIDKQSSYFTEAHEGRGFLRWTETDDGVWDLYRMTHTGEYLRLKGDASAPISTSKQVNKEEDGKRSNKISEVQSSIRENNFGSREGAIVVSSRRSKLAVVNGHLKHNEIVVKSKTRIVIG